MTRFWRKRKVYLAYILWRFKLRLILPNDIVNRKKIIECGSPLVDISGDDTFSFDRRCARRGGCWVRADLVPMLRDAATALPDGHRLHIFVGWRSMAYQWERFLTSLERNRKNNPNLSEYELNRMTRMYTADPAGPLCPHQTGGALDLTIVDKYGRELDMGSPFAHSGRESQMDYTDLETTAHYNRLVLHNAMTGAGFQNYPGEWWHYSYGDRAWAAYGRRPNAIYDRAYCTEYKITDDERKILASNRIKLKDGE